MIRCRVRAPGPALLAALLIASPARAQIVDCNTPEAEPWITETQARLLSEDDPAPRAVTRFVTTVVRTLGEPTGCAGQVTSELDGASFGALTLTFAGDVELVFETMAPDFTIVSLEAAGGFPDPAWARGVMTAFTRDWSLDIDWTTAERATDGDLSTEAYWHPDTGVNGQIRFSYRGDVLVAVTVSRS